MTDNKTDQDQIPSLPIHVQAQYIKDLSFECPDPLKSLQPSEDQPSININVEVQAHKIDDENFEVVLMIKADATREDEKVFLLELSYGGVFMLKGLPEDVISPALLVECPRILFPFARGIVANTTREAGFPPLSLSPVDFAEIYRRQSGQEDEKN